MQLDDFIRSIFDRFPSNFAIFVIPWIRSSIKLLKRNLIRKLVNGVGKDSSEMVINLINVIIIRGFLILLQTLIKTTYCSSGADKIDAIFDDTSKI